MKRLVLLVCFATLLLGAAAAANASTEVKMTGDSRIYGVYFANHNFTGWNTASWSGSNPGSWGHSGTKTEDRFQLWERFRLRSDFVANEAVKFRLGIKVEDTWGHGTLTAANSTVAISVYQAYLQFKLPNCAVEVTAGLQDLDLPHSSLFNTSPVFGGDRMAALTIKAPLIDNTLGLLAGFGRAIDTNRTYDTTTTQVADEFDVYFLALPVTVDGFKVTPWGMVGVAGSDANYWSTGFGQNIVSAGDFMTPTGWKNNQNAYWWVGGSFEVTALDPVRLYADVIYGAGAQSDRKKNKREGWFLDAGLEYTGWDVLTPKAFGWWSTGEDGSTRNGSERMAYIHSSWGAGNSFLFDDTQILGKESNMGVSPVGNWGIGASLDNISFVEKLTSRVTYTYVRGTNSAKALRYLNTSLGNNPYFRMGRDLTAEEYVMGVNLDSKYMIYENLAAVLETGWAHGQFQTSVWGHRLAERARSADSWKVAFGLNYKF
ncbi:conserved hypothetical protein [Solidesulfovibrio fructosivorans JJ]]|uniref:Outer membrane homotrimeric porin n=1 Tax=Solidesulfovibrio fructosivorans JJ] TaxID=596151 RepID=E1JX40_SOLFR|nr:outer membrane homotrimeric porin [Solidesulfovibrio fructosivorans]EFL51005.1 conserved hypothetical protein [Solidesulfovibrio fructosivorans JJ]]